jgi:hypothetical protein
MNVFLVGVIIGLVTCVVAKMLYDYFMRDAP